MIGLYFIAGAIIGLECSVLALIVALPVAVVAALVLAAQGLIPPGLWSLVGLCIAVQIGFFAGCVLRSVAEDHAERRSRAARPERHSALP